MNITLLDRRHNGYGIFDYMVTPTGSNLHERIHQFHKWRSWLWEIYGPSMELQYTAYFRHQGRHCDWAWDTEHNRMRLYVKTPVLSNFALKWA